ncbi:EAL domain-containing protein [Alteriqipengyuania sp. 357]
MPRPCVHIIDDDEEVCSELYGALLAAGYDCTWSTSADRPTRPANRDPDILLLDLGLPDMDGFQVIRRLAEADHQPHLIVASGQEHRIIQIAVRYARDVGLPVLGSLEKPYSIRSLLALVDAFATPKRTVASSPDTPIGRLDGIEHETRTVFQSKRRLSDRTITGYEALLRVALNGEPISPETMFGEGVEQETQLALTRAVLDDALQFGSQLRRVGTPARMSINCPPAILCSSGFPEMVFDALDRWRMPAASLMIEITEQPTGHSFDAVATAACRLAMRGCGISIDDFGRGTTSLERLFDLPLHELKIDKEIFWKCFEGREPPGLLKEVIRYCEERGIASTIEGIETIEHFDYAASLGAQQGQGYFWERPCEAASLSRSPRTASPGR